MAVFFDLRHTGVNAQLLLVNLGLEDHSVGLELFLHHLFLLLQRHKVVIYGLGFQTADDSTLNMVLLQSAPNFFNNDLSLFDLK